MTNVIRLSVTEAARLFGVETKTIRRAIKANQVKYIVVQGRYKINFTSLLEWSQGKTTTKNKLAQRGLGQYVDKWKIRNKLYSPNPESLTKKNDTNIS
jgi:excisionase family DNA binding protein